ncbi:RDD family protein [uncultured Clostridium sp.]|uniref:RDD family protein n=1 Tax=uncultured Clostridium sp. TaxID=59620 RepID=UPI0025EF8493|nr:RDD family protein [uncultured Clostridium sp.]
MQNNNQQQILYAGFLVRLWAYIIDCIIVGFAMLIIRIAMFIISLFFPNAFLFNHILFKFSVVDIFIYLCSAAYFIFMTYNFGATLGKKAMKIKVCKENEENLPLIDVVYRETIGRYLSGLILCIGYLLIAVDNRKRALHDMLCDTVVIYNFSVKRPEPLCSEIIIPENNDDIQGSI